MEAPTVIDHTKRAVIKQIVGKSTFNIFNVIALLIILLLAFLGYRRYTQKYPAAPAPVAAEPETPTEKEE